jgi:uncharacterized membrane protein
VGPYTVALAVERVAIEGRQRLALVGAVVWLAFLPNAPYLVSDLTHLEVRSTTPWLDLARLFAFAFTGCVLCGASLRIMHRVVAQRAGMASGFFSCLVVVSYLGLAGTGDHHRTAPADRT